jgi:4-hydroxy-tetrahydrodipicolinate reductase
MSTQSSQRQQAIATPVPIIVNGAAGRMGNRILALAIEDALHFSIIAGVDQKPVKPAALGLPHDIVITDKLPKDKGAVVVDFSHHAGFPALVKHCAANHQALLIGTTGIAPNDLEAGLSELAHHVPVLAAANMSVGVNILLRTAAQLARALGPDYDIEIVEAHHHHKKDAPSGTAFAIADAICAATHRTRSNLVHGRQGHSSRQKGEIGVHALRLGDVVGDHSVYFVGNGERILLGHVAHSRDIFASGALRAAAFLAKQKPGRYTMDHVLGL